MTYCDGNRLLIHASSKEEVYNMWLHRFLLFPKNRFPFSEVVWKHFHEIQLFHNFRILPELQVLEDDEDGERDEVLLPPAIHDLPE